MKAALTAMLAVASVVLTPKPSLADEGGVSFWVPGFFGSLAATPQQPGWSFATVFYHPSVSGGADVARSRAITIGKFNPTVDVTASLGLTARPDVGFVIPTYVFGTPILGGQASVSMAAAFGRAQGDVAGTVTATLGPLSVTRPEAVNDSRLGVGDMVPQASLRWNQGVHNWMTYLTGDVPVGTYDSKRLANLGIGHWAIDAGGGYTYFNPQTGHELSGVAGFTYNFINPSTGYQNGIDFHFDWGASYFLTKQWQVGAVGYVYQQLTGDGGAGDRVGAFRSRVLGVGPQIGYLFPVGDMQGYLNLKGYKELDAENRASGWNVWLTFALSPAVPTPPSTPPRRVITK